MKIILNDTPMDFSGESLTDLITSLDKQSDGLAIAINEHIVPKHQWPETLLAEHVRVSIFDTIAGG